MRRVLIEPVSLLLFGINICRWRAARQLDPRHWIGPKVRGALRGKWQALRGL